MEDCVRGDEIVFARLFRKNLNTTCVSIFNRGSFESVLSGIED